MYANRYEKRDFRGNKMLTKLEELIGKGPVSYTHLDVYKRQGLRSTVYQISQQI